MVRAQGGPRLTWHQLTSSTECADEAACAVFRDLRPGTVAMTVLVMVEMFNALNALSENNSLLQVRPPPFHRQLVMRPGRFRVFLLPRSSRDYSHYLQIMRKKGSGLVSTTQRLLCSQQAAPGGMKAGALASLSHLPAQAPGMNQRHLMRPRLPRAQLPPWRNPWLLGAIGLSVALHCAILYLRPLSLLFSVTALGAAEWRAILWLSLPVIAVDELLKYVTRCAPPCALLRLNAARAARRLLGAQAPSAQDAQLTPYLVARHSEDRCGAFHTC